MHVKYSAFSLLVVAVACAGALQKSSTVAKDTNIVEKTYTQAEIDAEARRISESVKLAKKRQTAITNALKQELQNHADGKVAAWHNFLNHWPSAKQQQGFAWYADKGVFRGDIGATALIEERYTLQIILNFDISKDYQAVTFTEIRFHFSEIKEIRDASGGGGYVDYEPGSTKWFEIKEWERLKQSNWDFSAIGIAIISNRPVANIHEMF